MTIAENSKDILNMNDMILGVSLQLTKLMADKGKFIEDPVIIGTTSSSHQKSSPDKINHH